MVCITDPTNPKNLYPDGWGENDEYYRYGGTGRKGDQSFVGAVGSWNAKVRDHATTGKPIELFHVRGALLAFVGGFELHMDAPFGWETELDEDNTPREIILFRFWPKAGTGVLFEDPIRPEETPGKEHAPSGKGSRSGGDYEINYDEDVLVGQYKEYLGRQEISTSRLRFPNPGGRYLENDVWVVKRQHLIEAKANPTREDVRMVIGQIADYRRWKPEATVGALFGSRPSNDLCSLLESQGIAVVWRTEEGDFNDTADGAFL